MSIVPADRSISVIQENQKLYMDARQRAFTLEESLEDAQHKCIQEIHELVNQIQQKYLLTYENEIEELSRLKEDIRHIQEKGRLSLVKKLNNIYREGKNPSCEQVRQQVNTLIKEYKELYFPNDAYQQKLQKQALSLRNAVLGQFSRGLASSSSSSPRMIVYHGNDEEDDCEEIM
jgi:type I site-specific restriction-modification system R (restriction) subunit